MVRLLAVFVLVLIGGAQPLQAAPCSGAEAARVRAAGAGLTAAIAAPGEMPDPVLSTPERQAISAMKDSMGSFLDAHLACSPAGSVAALQAALTEAAGFDPAADYPFSIEVRAGPGTDDRIGIVARFPIPCGQDAVLRIYERDDGGRWAPVLGWQSASYDEVSGGFWAFDYALSPPDADGNWYVAAKSVAPWCSSTWSVIRYAVMRPGVEAATPRVLLRAEDGIWWGSDDLGALTVDRGQFDIRFRGGSVDLDAHDRLWIRRFAVVGDDVRRIAPVAASPRDFVDEWIVSPWAIASGWTRPQDRAALAPLHGRLKEIGYFSFRSVRRCQDRGDHYQVRLAADDSDVVLFLQVSGDADFTLTGAGTTAVPGCDGPELLESMIDR